MKNLDSSFLLRSIYNRRQMDIITTIDMESFVGLETDGLILQKKTKKQHENSVEARDFCRIAQAAGLYAKDLRDSFAEIRLLDENLQKMGGE